MSCFAKLCKNICLLFALFPPERFEDAWLWQKCRKPLLLSGHFSTLRLVHGSFNGLTWTIALVSALLTSSFMFVSKAGATAL
jgi:hypothetical protein